MCTEDYPPARCPKCGQLVEATGEATLDGEHTLPVYECGEPTCTKPFVFEGEAIDAPLTFAVGADGRAVILDLDG
jgi:hypothetical protein